MTTQSLIKLCRPAQWAKNGFIFLPMFFGGQLTSLYCWEQSLLAFLAFSFMASAIYCLNDLIDVKSDRQHPTKCKRPIASGAVKPWQAITVMLALMIVSVTLTCFINGINRIHAVAILAMYACLNVAYCLKLKHLVIIDVFVIALGFVLRLIFGGKVCDIWLSPWIVSMTFLLSLFLAFAKRRDDYIILETTGIAPRRTVTRYNLEFLNQTLAILASITMVCYILYTVSPEVVARLGSQYVYVSAAFVLAGILRYLQVTIVDSQSGSPTKVIYKDHFIHTCFLGWLITFFSILYL